jgi:phage tail sheath protein FI
MAQYTYPGVYIEEIPSGVRTITGVATSITAFAGWAPQGPTDEAREVQSWADYDRTFGGLHRSSAMSYAVSHFFANGGGRAYIIRLVDAENAAMAQADAGGLAVVASGPGLYGNDYYVSTEPRATAPERFRLTVLHKRDTDTAFQTLEVFENLSADPADPRFVRAIIDQESLYLNVAPDWAPDDIGATDDPVRLQGGEDGTVLAPGDAAFELGLLPPPGDDGALAGGLYHLDRIDLFNLLCVPGETDPDTLGTLAAFCRTRRAFLIADAADTANEASVRPIETDDGINAAIYYPWLRMSDPLQENRIRSFPPSGAVAGIYARTDARRNVWKSPAGIEASVVGARAVTKKLTDTENGTLNPRAVNCVRTFDVYGTVVWGARTCRGNDEIGSEWKYVAVRRMALFIEETLYRSLKWVVFEPNDEPLWAQIRLNVGAFMHDQFRQGAFQGRTPREAYFVKCDKETTTQNDINRGIVNILVGFAPLKPAEFVVVKLQQMAGQIDV